MDVVEWEPVDGPTYVYVQLADHIGARIRAGELRSGARLPNEMEMVEEYHVSLSTVRRAIAELRARELVETVPAKGDLHPLKGRVPPRLTALRRP